MAERGLVGAISCAIILVMLVVTFVSRIVKSSLGHSFLPAGVLSLLVFAAVAVQTFFDVSVFRADVALSLFAVLSVGASSFVRAPAGCEPRVKRHDKNTNE